MEPKKSLTPRIPRSEVSRRSLLGGVVKGAAAMAAAASVPARAAAGPVIAYVGAYTDRGKGIHMYYVQPDGFLLPWKILTGLPNPSSLAFSPNKKFLYAVNEVSNFDTNSGSVTAISVAADGDLRIMNVVNSGGRGPAHLSVDPSGKWVFAANYGAGSVGVLPIRADGSLGDVTDVQKIPDAPLGVQPAVDAPPGSFANSGHDAAHAHQAQTDPAGNFLYVADLGTDRIYVFRLDKTAGKLTPAPEPFMQATAGAGPRHFDFHPNGQWVYAITEEASTLLFMTYNSATGALTLQASVSSLPIGYEGTNYPSEIHVSDDGRFVYAANRLHDTITQFYLDASGVPYNINQFWTRGSYPRHFAIEPYGRFLYVCHSRSDNITAFGVDAGTGDLNFTGRFTGVGNPSKIVFLAP
ncbi:MAG: lactonase family protein [Acidobacteria bacterium]|nr:lactonase family protein [Acidobacteriota bacterium]